jgi:putative CocE/NonD family hydrolase
MKNTAQGSKHKVVEEKGWIPVRDGTRLAATFFWPQSDEKLPAIFEYLPYRKDDGPPATSDSRYHRFAEQGYVYVRVDVRGTGSSEGEPAENEYVVQEQLDGYDCIEWLAAQDWCTGKIGMQGGSYGGFNSVLVAAQQPPHLTAISPWFYTDDGYTDGDHFEGGCLSALGLCYYGLSMLTMNALPPDPAYFEDEAGSWEARWRARLENYEPWILEWFDHQTNDEFWHVQSLRPDYGAIKCPMYMFGGWGDHFRNAIPRMLRHCTVPMKAVIGPWVHSPPDTGYPGPKIDWFGELLRWWDHWLKGIDNGVMDEPSLTVYVQKDRPPGTFAEFADGYWRYENGWPVDDAQEAVRYFGEGGSLSSAPTAASQAHDQLVYRPEVGVMGNVWFSQACSLGEEQSLDEAYSLTYTSEPLDADLEILGFPHVELYASSSAENTAFVVKLTEVNPEGQSNLITYGVLNAAHRNSHAAPEALEPDEIYKLFIELFATSWVLKKGNRIRVAVTSSHWPILWPLPDAALNRVFFDKEHASRLVLPVVPEREHPHVAEFQAPDVKERPRARPSIKITRDLFGEEVIVEVERKRAYQMPGRDRPFRREGRHEARTSTRDPGISCVHTENYSENRYSNGVTVEARGTGTVSSNRKQFVLNLNVNITLNGRSFFDKTWLKTVPRHFI